MILRDLIRSILLDRQFPNFDSFCINNTESFAVGARSDDIFFPPKLIAVLQRANDRGTFACCLSFLVQQDPVPISNMKMVSSAGLGRSHLPDMFLPPKLPAGRGSIGAHQVVTVVGSNCDRSDQAVTVQSTFLNERLLRLH